MNEVLSHLGTDSCRLKIEMEPILWNILKKNVVQFGQGVAFDFISVTLVFISGFAYELEFGTVRYA